MLKTSTKLSDFGKLFLNKIAINRIKADMEIKLITPSDALDIIVKYFKSNNDEYTEMIHTEVKNEHK